jgi:hypothetical protein
MELPLDPTAVVRSWLEKLSAATERADAAAALTLFLPDAWWRDLLGGKVADRLGVVWGLDEEGEIRTMWRRSGHPGFWFMGGNLHQCRHYSKVMALQIKAIEEDLVEPATGRSRQPASSHL